VEMLMAELFLMSNRSSKTSQRTGESVRKKQTKSEE